MKKENKNLNHIFFKLELYKMQIIFLYYFFKIRGE